jgi:4-amino-4-deoxy-L-arabinose transferase-like glycosyltransferase
MLVCLAVFSLSSGIFHQYYSVQLAPAVAALAGAGSVALWKLGGQQRWFRWLLPTAIVVTAGWAVMLLDRTPDYHPWLRPAIVAGAAIAAVGLWLGRWLRRRAIVLAAAGVAAVTLLAGPAAYALTTVQRTQNGSIVTAGPATDGAGAGGGAGFGAAGAGGGGQGPGGFGGTSTTDSALISYLEAHRGNAKYLVATFGSQSSATIIIATGQPVITIGGFNGGDPAPTLAQFEALVAKGEVRYVLVTGNGAGFGGGAPGGAGGQSIASWVTSHGKEVQLANSTTTGGGTLYDVSGAA